MRRFKKMDPKIAKDSAEAAVQASLWRALSPSLSTLR
jgi:hypothetical protein